MYDLIIVGGGPAGLAAAVYAARKLLSTLLITHDIGGQVNWTMGVENYLGYQLIEGPELISKFQQQVEKFPIDRKVGYDVSRIEKTANSHCRRRRRQGRPPGTPLLTASQGVTLF